VLLPRRLVGMPGMLSSLIRHTPTFAVDVVRLCLWLAILTAIFVPLERMFALHPGKIFRKGAGADLGYFFLGGLTTSLLLSVPLGILAWATHRLVPHALQTAFDGASFWTRAFASLLAGEIGYYWGHRLMHEIPLLWRFHAIHHSPKHVDFLVNSRVHPIDLTFGRMCAFVPLFVLGLAHPTSGTGITVPALLTLVGTVWAFFVHANVWWRLGPLEWVIATPRFHHWHHAMVPANRNYASMLPVLDRIFGTMHLPGRQWPPCYGISEAVPDSWAEQLVRPLIGSFPVSRAEQLPPDAPPAGVS
jgi:sterol desaturase/sphingolipid hydroxylase (fatty acid hydroxylase superfamily)